MYWYDSVSCPRTNSLQHNTSIQDRRIQDSPWRCAQYLEHLACILHLTINVRSTHSEIRRCQTIPIFYIVWTGIYTGINWKLFCSSDLSVVRTWLLSPQIKSHCFDWLIDRYQTMLCHATDFESLKSIKCTTTHRCEMLMLVITDVGFCTPFNRSDGFLMHLVLLSSL